ncbi:MAG: ComF family protein [Rickettsiales bacterium]|jgi:ComF family protein|nr:ComF family protein [Rickettsiales bacterium]
MFNVFKKFFNIIFPSTCHVCKEVIHCPGVCDECWKGLVFITNPKCKLCGFPFEFYDVESNINTDLVCLRCLKDKPDFDRAVAVLKYNDAAKKIVLPFKHSDRTNLRYFISDLMVATISSENDILDDLDFIIPVPLHFKRLLKRKYNQAALLATCISQKVSAPYLNALRRIRFSESQGHLSLKKRRENIKNCFDIRLQCVKKIINKNILLIDDVMTTGATVNECAKMLKKAGAKKVYVLSFCKVY